MWLCRDVGEPARCREQRDAAGHGQFSGTTPTGGGGVHGSHAPQASANAMGWSIPVAPTPSIAFRADHRRQEVAVPEPLALVDVSDRHRRCAGEKKTGTVLPGHNVAAIGASGKIERVGPAADTPTPRGYRPRGRAGALRRSGSDQRPRPLVLQRLADSTVPRQGVHGDARRDVGPQPDRTAPVQEASQDQCPDPVAVGRERRSPHRGRHRLRGPPRSQRRSIVVSTSVRACSCLRTTSRDHRRPRSTTDRPHQRLRRGTPGATPAGTCNAASRRSRSRPPRVSRTLARSATPGGRR